MGRERTFQHDVGDVAVIGAALDTLEHQVAGRLRRRGYRGRRVTVTVRFDNFETREHGLTLSRPTADAERIRRAAQRCLAAFRLDRKVRLVGVRVSDLEKESA